MQPQADAPREDFKNFQRVLLEFHGNRRRPRCGCIHAGRPLELVIRRLSNDHFILARMPNEGASHRETCDFYSAAPDRSGRAGYVDGVMEEMADGGYRVRLGLSLTINEVNPDPAPAASRTGRPGAARQRAMTPLGLLHALWEEAQLNNWRPGFRGRRSPWQVAWRLSNAAGQFQVVRSELSDLFTTIAPRNRRAGYRLLQLTQDIGKRRRLVIVGTVTSIKPEQYGRREIRLSEGPAARLFLSALPGQIDTLLTRHPYADRLLTAPAAYGEQVMGLFIVEAKEATWKGRPIVKASLQAGALLEVTADFIPVASDLERQVAGCLVTEGRAFTKPLRFDAAADLVLPDFVLTDTANPSEWPMEVYGRDDANYQARREEKEAYYRATYGMGRFWQWVAAGPDRTEMPDLPLRSEV